MLVNFARLFDISKLKVSYRLLRCHLKGNLRSITGDCSPISSQYNQKRSQKADVRDFAQAMARENISIYFLERPVISRKDLFVMRFCHGSGRKLLRLFELFRDIVCFYRICSRF